jgi:hypothetical protein
MSQASRAVFLSFARQRAAGIEFFLDQSELGGGDAWDQKIRHQIHNCALFIPIISQQERVPHRRSRTLCRTMCGGPHMATNLSIAPELIERALEVSGEQTRELLSPKRFRSSFPGASRSACSS